MLFGDDFQLTASPSLIPNSGSFRNRLKALADFVLQCSGRGGASLALLKITPAELADYLADRCSASGSSV